LRFERCVAPLPECDLLIVRRLAQPYVVWAIIQKQGGPDCVGATDLDWHMDWAAQGDPKATRSVLTYAIKLVHGRSACELPHAVIDYNVARHGLGSPSPFSPSSPCCRSSARNGGCSRACRPHATSASQRAIAACLSSQHTTCAMCPHRARTDQLHRARERATRLEPARLSLRPCAGVHCVCGVM
jgi:hypothetical protein